jgi:hypothetical protein
VLIPLIVTPVRVQLTLVAIPVEVWNLQLTVQRFRIYACNPPHTVATMCCI